MTQQVHVIDAVCPAAIPAARHAIFTGAFTPHGRAIRTCSAARSARPARCARAITGTRPACDTRCGSSNVAPIFASSCNNRTCEVSSPARRRKRKELPSFQLRGHLSRRRAGMDTYLRGGLRLSAHVAAKIIESQRPRGPLPELPGCLHSRMAGDTRHGPF